MRHLAKRTMAIPRTFGAPAHERGHVPDPRQIRGAAMVGSRRVARQWIEGTFYIPSISPVAGPSADRRKAVSDSIRATFGGAKERYGEARGDESGDPPGGGDRRRRGGERRDAG